MITSKCKKYHYKYETKLQFINVYSYNVDIDSSKNGYNLYFLRRV